jgi:hypothetical protein
VLFLSFLINNISPLFGLFHSRNHKKELAGCLFPSQLRFWPVSHGVELVEGLDSHGFPNELGYLADQIMDDLAMIRNGPNPNYAPRVGRRARPLDFGIAGVITELSSMSFEHTALATLPTLLLSTLILVS